MGVRTPESRRGGPVVPSLAMAKDLVSVYEAILRDAKRALGLPDTTTTRSKLYTLLLKDPIDPRLADVLNRHGVSASYTRTHLLSIGSWPKGVQEAMRQGLPYQDARRIAQLDSSAQRTVLAAFAKRAGEAPRQATATARAIERKLEHDRIAEAITCDEEGWVAPLPAPKRRRRGLPGALVYDELGAGWGMDQAPRKLIEGLLAAYVEPGERVVDLMAGAGIVAVAGRDSGRWVWSADVEPRHAFIHRLDARDCIGIVQSLGRFAGQVELAVIHAYKQDAWDAKSGRPTPSDIANRISQVVQCAACLVTSGGCVSVVLRPQRGPNEVALLTDLVKDALEHFVGRLVGYHIAVAARDDVDWHLLVARRRQAV